MIIDDTCTVISTSSGPGTTRDQTAHDESILMKTPRKAVRRNEGRYVVAHFSIVLQNVPLCGRVSHA